MTLLISFQNLINDVKNDKNIDKNILKKKYKDIFDSSEKLFDKICDPKLSDNDIKIIKIMLQKKEERMAGTIEKLEADTEIGQVLCDTYVKPLLDKDKGKDK
tara:strand:- start:632 stop:937 length:306 start_codon:yes stop_codon:yes gene_type:complete